MSYSEMLANAPFTLMNTKWRGLQPKNQYKYGGRYVYTSEQYREYCSTHTKEERKRKVDWNVSTEKSEN